jgi:drug/metabolite transporter superfamily protein YnfA
VLAVFEIAGCFAFRVWVRRGAALAIAGALVIIGFAARVR